MADYKNAQPSFIFRNGFAKNTSRIRKWWHCPISKDLNWLCENSLFQNIANPCVKHWLASNTFKQKLDRGTKLCKVNQHSCFALSILTLVNFKNIYQLKIRHSGKWISFPAVLGLENTFSVKLLFPSKPLNSFQLFRQYRQWFFEKLIQSSKLQFIKILSCYFSTLNDLQLLDSVLSYFRLDQITWLSRCLIIDDKTVITLHVMSNVIPTNHS